MSQNRPTDFPGTTPSNSGTGQTGGSQFDRSTTGTGPGTASGPGTGIGLGTGTGSGSGTGTATGLAQTAQQYGEKITEAAGQAKEFVTDKIGVVGEKFKDLQNADYAEMAENAKDYARKNPGQAILISAAAGLLLGLVLRGRRS